jgi:uncharacterized protein (DUF1810 family)
MATAIRTPGPNDPFDLERFTSTQKAVYERALSELRNGRKRTHWMWFIFPQIDGLGHSATAKHYAIKNIEEARQYLAHPVLGPRLLECTQAVLNNAGRSVAEILGYPDDLKLKSSMTLFERAMNEGSVFAHVLEEFYHGERDTKTLRILGCDTGMNELC